MTTQRRIDTEPVEIFHSSARYTTFPDVKRLPDDRLLCVFRDASFPERVTHIEPDARIVGTLSEDHGQTWSAPFVIYDDPHCQNDPSVAVLNDGSLMLTFFNWVGLSEAYVKEHKRPYARRVDHGQWGVYAEPAGVHCLRGLAGSVTFAPHARHVVGNAHELFATSSAVIETSKGTLLMPVYGRAIEQPIDRAFVCRSDDNGQTWSDPQCIAVDPAKKVRMQEPTLVEAANGDIIAMLRTAEANDHLYVVRSSDDGKTWTPARPTELIGHPADCQLLPDGRLIVVYGYRHKPFGVRACISNDHGKTWSLDNEIVIAQHGGHFDLGYPSVCLTADDHLCIAYYINSPDNRDRWIECQLVALSNL